MKKLLVAAFLLFFLSGCAERRVRAILTVPAPTNPGPAAVGRAILTIPAPTDPGPAAVGCVWKAKMLSKWSLNPPLLQVVVHNNSSFWLLLLVNGCPVVDEDTTGHWRQEYLLPGRTKPLDFSAFNQTEIVLMATAHCPEEVEGCQKGQYVGEESREFWIYPGDGRWRVEPFEVNIPYGQRRGVR